MAVPALRFKFMNLYESLGKGVVGLIFFNCLFFLIVSTLSKTYEQTVDRRSIRLCSFILLVSLMIEMLFR
jgi:hypothetical protein